MQTTVHIIGEDPKVMPKGRCIDCKQFRPITWKSNNQLMTSFQEEGFRDYNHSACKKFEQYMTLNAFRKIACKYFEYNLISGHSFFYWNPIKNRILP